jgi:hypothetical protein
VVHDAHRRATSLLADAIARDEAPHDAVTALRDLVVAMLRHHHESEDEDLWPSPRGTDPLPGAARPRHRCGVGGVLRANGRESAPSVGTHLLVGLFHEVAIDGEVELILRHLPSDAMSLVPAMRAEAEPTLGALRGAGR